MGLTPKQEAFVQHYVFGKGGKYVSTGRAHALAGYGPNMSNKTHQEHACRMLGMGKIQARIDELRKTVVQANIVTLDGLTTDLRAVYELAMNGAQELVRDADGEIVWLVEGVLPKTRETKPNAGSAVRAIEAIAKLHGLFDDKVRGGTGLPTIEERLLRYENDPTWKPGWLWSGRIVRQ